jgi:lipopolysaccharide/colanic/teichoic acid biosynthesis glycosyltransferase
MRERDDQPVEGLQVRSFGGVVGIEYTNNLLIRSNGIIKRAIDLTVATVALVVSAPIIGLASALVIAIDRGPALFFQQRVGLAGRRFLLPKIRTMRLDAETRLEEYLSGSDALREEWQSRYKLRNDPRVLPGIGSVLRRFSLDELPQLWSVVRGDMSLVGPRPFPEYHVRQLPAAFLRLRERVRPGITGLWQIAVRSDAGMEAQQAYDTYYIRNWSVWLDVYVLSRTLAAVIRGRGAY